MAKINENEIINDAKARKDLRKEIVERLKDDKNPVKKYYKFLEDNEKKVRKYMDGLNNLIQERALQLPLKYFIDEEEEEIIEEITKTIENPEEASKYVHLGLHKWFWKQVSEVFAPKNLIYSYISANVFYRRRGKIFFNPREWPDVYEEFINWFFVNNEEEYKGCEQEHIYYAMEKEKEEVEASIKEFMGEVLSK